VTTECIVQEDLPAAIREGRYPLYKTPIHDITDEALARIVPDPFGVEYLVPIFTEALQSVYIQQMKRMLMPRPSNNATLSTYSRGAPQKKKKRSKQPDESPEQVDDQYYDERRPGPICGLEFLINSKTKLPVSPDIGTFVHAPATFEI
jgi:hypothetical protein